MDGQGEILRYFACSLLRSLYLWSAQDPSLVVSVSRVEYAPLERSVVDRFTPEERASVRLLPVDVDISCAGHRASRVPDSAACCTDASPALNRVAALLSTAAKSLPYRLLPLAAAVVDD